MDFSPCIDLPKSALDAALGRGESTDEHFQYSYLDMIPVPEDQATAKNSLQFWLKTKEPFARRPLGA